MINENEIDILCIQEAEIGFDDAPDLLEIPGYNLEVECSKDYYDKRTIMYIKNNITYKRRKATEREESHIILITLENGLGIASIYRTYKLTHQQTFSQAFQEQIQILEIFSDNHEEMIIVGDMNLDFNKRNTTSYHHRRLYDSWISFEEEKQLTQLVDSTTWHRVSRGRLQSSILDHVYTTNVGLVECVEIIDALSGDHQPVLVTLTTVTEPTRTKKWIRDWQGYSKEKLLNELAKEDWNINRADVQDFCDELDRKIMNALHTLIPFRHVVSTNKSFNEPRAITRLKKKKNNLLTNARRRNNPELFSRCKKLGRKIRGEIRKKECNKIRAKILDGGQSGLWQGLKMAMDSPHECIPKTMTDGRESFVGEDAVAQAFANFFQKKVEGIVESSEIDINIYNGERVIVDVNKNFFTKELVQSVMEDLKEKNSYGFDNIPQRILKEGASVLMEPFHKLLNLIYQQKKLPEQWKTSRIIPLHKKGKKSELKNYRPISNLCAATKIFEKAVLTRILGLAEADQLFSSNQHGFRKKRSTTTAAKHLQAVITRAMEKGDYVAVASIDMSAAFDVINVELLMKRLEIMGFPQDIMSLLASWLNGRWAYVEVDGCCSSYFQVKNGTVQGSCLGPVLFNLFISPLLKTSSGPAYADDSYHISSGATKDVVLTEIQEKIMAAEKWMSGSGLKVNLEKTEMVIFHRMDTSSGVLKIGNIQITSSGEMNVLGIVFDNRLQWDRQVDKAIRETRKTAQALKTVKRYFSTEELLKLCTAICFSKLYYASEVWLLPNLKECLFKKLYSQSGKCLKIVEMTKSFRELHVTYHRATPKLFALYQTSLYYYDVVNGLHFDPLEAVQVQYNTVADRRNKFLTFVRNNNYRQGLNSLSNRLRSISNMIEKSWLILSREMFKTKCKINIIQTGLSVL